MKKILCFLLCICSCSVGHSQFTKAVVAIDGLTCSACSYATQRSVLQLDFVEDVTMDLNSHQATILFKKDKMVSMEKIAEKVVDAGFSVGGMTAEINLKKISISKDFCLEYEGAIYHFISTENKELNGLVGLQFIGPRYMRKKDFKKYKSMLSTPCKSLDKSNPVSTIYFVIPA
ncbi:MAG: heavy metal-associated domain-containing protein [Bacteroidota bacterium]